MARDMLHCKPTLSCPGYQERSPQQTRKVSASPPPRVVATFPGIDVLNCHMGRNHSSASYTK